MLARPGTSPVDGHFVRLSAVDVQGPMTPPINARRVDVGGHEGWIEESGTLRSLQVLRDGDDIVLIATAGQAVTDDDLIELATAWDTTQELTAHTVPEGWETVLRWSDLARARTRSINLSADSGPDGDDWSGSHITISSITGVPPDTALWMLASGPMEPITVRGVHGWRTPERRGGFQSERLTWVDHQQMVVTVSLFTSDIDADGAGLVLEAADELVPVDAAGWEEFVGRPEVRTVGDSDSARSGNETTGTTMTPSDVGAPTPTMPAFPDMPEVSASIEGRVDDGPRFQLYALADTGQLCWRFEGEANPHCDPEGPLSIGGENASQPRLAVSPDGETALVYAAMPPGAVGVEMTALSQTGDVGTVVMDGSGIWAAKLPSGYGAVDVRYLDEDGNVVAEVNMS